MKSSKPAALRRLGNFIKGSLLNNLFKLQVRGYQKARAAVLEAVSEAIAAKKTPGAFGSARPPGRKRWPKWARQNYAAGNCGRGMPDIEY